MDFKNRLKELRLSFGLTQSELANKIGVATSTISMYEQGNREPNLDTIDALCDFFDVDTDYLLGKTYKTTMFPQSLNPKKPQFFTTKEEAIEFLLKQKVISSNTGIDISKYTDDEIIQFTNRLLDYARFLDNDKKKLDR